MCIRDRLYTAATPDPFVLTASSPRLSTDQLKAAAARAYPGYTIGDITGGNRPDQPVNISLNSPRGSKNERLFNPYTGEDLGDSVSFGIRVVSKLLELHDDLLAGER